MSTATIEEVKTKKPSHEQRLANFIKRQRIQSMSQSKNPKQWAMAEAKKKQSKKAKDAVLTLVSLLEGFGAEVTIEHTKAPLLPLSEGESGFGKRDIFTDIWFREDDKAPNFGEHGDECYISAIGASGYSVAKVEFKGDNAQIGTIYGKSICSANETFNGNIGAFFALVDALHILSRRKGIESPLQNLFFLVAALLPLRMESPSHYKDSLSMALSDNRC